MHGKKKGRNAILSAVMGTGVAIAIVLVLVALLSGLLLNEKIGEGIGAKLLYAVHIVAVFAGTEIAKRINGNSGVRIAGIVICIYGALIATVGLLAEGIFQNICVNLLSIGAGFLLSCALCIRKTGRNAKKKNVVW